MSDALDNARAALEQYDDHMRVDGYGADDHENLANALGRLIAERERLTAAPSDDVREALARLVEPLLDRAAGDYGDGEDVREEMVDAILAVFEVRPRGPVTDAEVEAAATILDGLAGPGNRMARSNMRIALEAARNAR